MADSVHTPSVRELVDPQGTLPAVEMIINPDTPLPRGTLRPLPVLFMHDGEPVGHSTLVRNMRQQTEHFSGVQIEDDYKGAGFGTAAYLAAVEDAHARGDTFRTHDWTQTGSAKRVWDRFIEAGVANVVEPFRLVGIEENGTEKYVGHVEIPPQKRQ